MDDTALDRRRPRALGVVAIFVVVVCLVGGVIGINSAPDAWYMALAKPAWNPPNWVFAPVWFLLYIGIGIAGGRTYLRAPGSVPMVLWTVQMLLNWAWSPVWFRLHQPWEAFAIIVAILLLVVGFILTSWKTDRVSASLFVPYAAWVAFASTLNLSIALLN